MGMTRGVFGVNHEIVYCTMKKVLRGDANTVVIEAEPKISTRRIPLSWGNGRWSLYLYLQTQFGKDRCTQFRVRPYRGNRPTITPMHPETGPITTLRRS